MNKLFFVPVFLAVILLTAGATVPGAGAAETTSGEKVVEVAAAKAQGKVLGISNKARTITVAEKDGPVMIKFTEATRGMEHARKGEAAIVTYRSEGKNRIALSVEPKLAKLPVGTVEIKPAELVTLLAEGAEKGNFLLIDARPAGPYAAGHIAGAVSIPVPKMKSNGKELLPKDKKGTMLIFYCGGPTCGMSTAEAGMAVKMGFVSVKVMLQGAPGWKKSGQPLVASHDFVKDGNAVVIDLRSPAEAEAGHLEGAVNIPAAELAETEDDFPASKAAPIVLYGAESDLKPAMKTIQGWGYKSVSLVDGGLAGWRAAGLQLATGPAATEINWVRKLGEGEISLEDFKMAAAGGVPDRIILDVRNVDETKDGMFTGAVNIPLDELIDRMTDLPKDKEILVHCTTGARAEMAHQTLKKGGFASRYLVAEVECEEGVCSAAE